MEEMKRTYHDVCKQRDELAEACQAVIEDAYPLGREGHCCRFCRANEPEDHLSDCSVPGIEAALAKMETNCTAKAGKDENDPADLRRQRDELKGVVEYILWVMPRKTAQKELGVQLIKRAEAALAGLGTKS